MRNSRSVLIMEKKPTSSGETKIVGGEIYPSNLVELTIANVFWILLLLVPIALVYVFARRGQRLPSALRTFLRLIPIAVRAFI